MPQSNPYHQNGLKYTKKFDELSGILVSVEMMPVSLLNPRLLHPSGFPDKFEIKDTVRVDITILQFGGHEIHKSDFRLAEENVTLEMAGQIAEWFAHNHFKIAIAR